MKKETERFGSLETCTEVTCLKYNRGCLMYFRPEILEVVVFTGNGSEGYLSVLIQDKVVATERLVSALQAC